MSSVVAVIKEAGRFLASQCEMIGHDRASVSRSFSTGMPRR